MNDSQEVLTRLELVLPDSKSGVITTYTTEPLIKRKLDVSNFKIATFLCVSIGSLIGADEVV